MRIAAIGRGGLSRQPENLTQADQTSNENRTTTDRPIVPMTNVTGESLLFNKLDADEQEDAIDGSPWERAG